MGALEPNALSYSERDVEAQLLKGLLEGDYVYLLDSHQKGIFPGVHPDDDQANNGEPSSMPGLCAFERGRDRRSLEPRLLSAREQA